MAEESKKRVSRRQFVTLAGGALGASAILAACGEFSATPTAPSNTAATSSTSVLSAAPTGTAVTTSPSMAAITPAGIPVTVSTGQAFTTDYTKVGKEISDAMAGKLRGKKVSLIHALGGEEEQKFIACFKDFQAKTGITVNLNSGGSVETYSLKVQSNTIEDIVNFPQPGTMADPYAKEGKVVDLNKVINQDWLKKVYSQGFLDTNTITGPDGTGILGGVFQRINFKSAVWYPKKFFDAAGYKVPTTWDEQQALMDQIVKDGDTPWSIGIANDSNTGWLATDWIEDIMLRTTSLENYDKWTSGALPFTDPIVKNAFQKLTDIWFNDKYVYGGRKAIATTDVYDAPAPLFQDPPRAWLHRQGNFIITFMEQMKPGIKAGVDYDFYYLPPIDPKYGKPVLFAGDLFSLFNDRPESRAVIQFLTTYESIQPWIKMGGGAISPHKNANLADYTTELDRKMAQTVLGATSARFDGSDLMPGAVGSGSFWKGITDYVSGASNLDQALQTIQDGWANVKN
jgi:alpha-glucoside transport system substrate-binding protein